MAEMEMGKDERYLNKVLRGEISAVETYDQVIRKFEGESESQRLAEFRRDHERAVETLKGMIRHEGWAPDSESGPWGAVAKTVTGVSKLFGDSSAVKALIEGEEHGLKQYREALDLDISEDDRRTIENDLIPMTERHINSLNAMIRSH